MDASNIENIDTLNIDKEESTISGIEISNNININNKSYVVSDADEELLILISFKQCIDLKSIKIYASIENIDDGDYDDMSAPKEVDIYHTKNININFDDIKSIKADKSICCNSQKLKKGQNINLQKTSKNAIKFKKTKYLAIYIKSNQNNTEKTLLNAITFKTITNNKSIGNDKREMRMRQKTHKQQVDAVNVIKEQMLFEIEKCIQPQPQFTAEMTSIIELLDDGYSLNEIHTAIQLSNACSCNEDEIWQEITNDFDTKVTTSHNNVSVHSMDNYSFYHQNKCPLSQCIHLKRLINALTGYHSFIQKQNLDEQTHEIDGTCNTVSILNDFHHLLGEHEQHFEEIHNELISTCNNGKNCTLTNCIMMRRNHRNRDLLSTKNVDLNKIYFGYNDINDIVKQQIMDKIHCHYFHSFDIGYRLSSNDRLQIQQNTMENDYDLKQDEMNGHVYDSKVMEICKHIKMKQKQYENTHGLETLNDNSSKFITTSNEKITAEYSYGFKFFYWEYYRNNVETRDPAQISLGCNDPFMRYTANEGYMLGDFFVVPKFVDLKDEMINNPICSISKHQWDILLKKSQKHSKTQRYRQHPCFKEFAQYFDVPKDCTITDIHLVAMLVYCNQTLLQMMFSETYRKNNEDETIQNVIQRHQNFAHLGRLLSETTDCFSIGGAAQSNLYYSLMTNCSSEMIFFHGITTNLQFASMSASIKGPVSTSIDYAVAVNFCANQGMILELKLDANIVCHGYVECAYISDFSNEQEVFFLGGYKAFRFKSIIQAATAQNYEKYVSALATITQFISGRDPDKQHTNAIKQICFRIILDQLHRHYPDNNKYVKFESMPEFARGLVERHFTNINFVWLFSITVGGYQEGFRKLFRYFFFDECDWIELEVLMKLFPGLQYIILGNRNDVECRPVSAHLSLLSILRKKTTINLKRVERVNVSVLIATEIVSEFEQEFRKFGWTIYIDKDAYDANPLVMQAMNSCDMRFVLPMEPTKGPIIKITL